MKLYFYLWISLIALSAQSSARAADALVDDLSREQLGRYATTFDSGPKSFSYLFHFPSDARADHIWGVDVSHHNGVVDWTKLASQSVKFAYAKATQGVGSYDATFAENWDGITKAGLRRGAYHFMTASDDASTQATNFLSTIGDLGANDLPPCLDLEWDIQIKSGKPVLGADGKPFDRWSSLSSKEIVDKVMTWIDAVEAKTGKTPIIYTNSHWWEQRIESEKGLGGYSIWVADYSSKSLGKELPREPTGASVVAWQLTDSGSFSGGGINGTIDTDMILSTGSEFNIP